MKRQHQNLPRLTARGRSCEFPHNGSPCGAIDMGGECTTYNHQFNNATVIVTCCKAHSTAMTRALEKVYLAEDPETAVSLALAVIPWLDLDIDPKRVVYSADLDPN